MWGSQWQPEKHGKTEEICCDSHVLGKDTRDIWRRHIRAALRISTLSYQLSSYTQINLFSLSMFELNWSQRFPKGSKGVQRGPKGSKGASALRKTGCDRVIIPGMHWVLIVENWSENIMNNEKQLNYVFPDFIERKSEGTSYIWSKNQCPLSSLICVAWFARATHFPAVSCWNQCWLNRGTPLNDLLL